MKVFRNIINICSLINQLFKLHCIKLKKKHNVDETETEIANHTSTDVLKFKCNIKFK